MVMALTVGHMGTHIPLTYRRESGPQRGHMGTWARGHMGTWIPCASVPTRSGLRRILPFRLSPTGMDRPAGAAHAIDPSQQHGRWRGQSGSIAYTHLLPLGLCCEPRWQPPTAEAREALLDDLAQLVADAIWNDITTKEALHDARAPLSTPETGQTATSEADDEQTAQTDDRPRIQSMGKTVRAAVGARRPARPAARRRTAHGTVLKGAGQ